MNDSAHPTPATAQPAAVSPTARRRRFGHPSTWLIVYLALVVLLLANLPGEFDHYSSRKPWEVGIRHGWPWTYLDRNVASIRQTESGLQWQTSPFLLWRLGDGSKAFHLAAALGNIAVGVLILIAVGKLAQWRRRRRHRVYQVTLFEWLFAVLLLAAGSATWAWLLNETDRQAAAMSAILGHFQWYAEWESPWPDWWSSGEPASGNPRPGHIVAIGRISQIVNWIPLGDATLILESLQQFPQVRMLRLGGTEIQDLNALENLSSCSQLQVLELGNSGLNDSALEPIARVSTLVDLDISDNDFTDAGLKTLYALKHLKHLNLMGNDLSVEAMKALRQALPGLEITHERMPPLKKSGQN